MNELAPFPPIIEPVALHKRDIYLLARASSLAPDGIVFFDGDIVAVETDDPAATVSVGGTTFFVDDAWPFENRSIAQFFADNLNFTTQQPDRPWVVITRAEAEL